MKAIALSIRQPWAWLIIRPDVTDPAQRHALLMAGQIKDVENRSRRTLFTGPCVVVASQKSEPVSVVEEIERKTGIKIPRDLPVGVTVGRVVFGQAVENHPSSWFMRGCYGYPLTDARPLPQIPVKGRLGFYDLQAEIVKQLGL